MIRKIATILSIACLFHMGTIAAEDFTIEYTAIVKTFDYSGTELTNTFKPGDVIKGSYTMVTNPPTISNSGNFTEYRYPEPLPPGSNFGHTFIINDSMSFVSNTSSTAAVYVADDMYDYSTEIKGSEYLKLV